MYTLPVLLATACSDNAETQSNNIQCVHPGEDLQAYYDLLTQNPQVVAAMDLCERPVSFQNQVWDKVREAEKTGLPPTAPLPVAYVELQEKGYSTEVNVKPSPFSSSEQFPAEYKIQLWKQGKLEEKIEVLSHTEDQITKIYVTPEEAHEIYAAHLAHSLWLEKNKIVPWSLREYSQEQLDTLLKPKTWFRDWDEKNEEYSFHLVLDHSPRETFDISTEAVSSFSDQGKAMDDIIRSVRPFRHGITLSYDGEGNLTDGHDPMEIVTVEMMKEEKISRHGCQTMSLYLVQLANSLNIPGRYLNGYYAAAGHRSALFDFTDDVLAHGDDVYHHTSLGNTPSSEVMGSHDFWEKNVLVYKKGDETAAHNSMIHDYKKAMQYPSYSLIRN